MATNLAEKISESFDKFECPVCKETFVDPRVLGCLHSYCKRCLKRLLKKVFRKHIVRCPICTRITEVSRI